MRSFYSIFFILNSFLTFGVNAQKTSIYGKVTNPSGQNVGFANLSLKGTVRNVQSNTEGEYIFKSLKVGQYTLVASMIGFETQEIKIELQENQNLAVDVVLKEASYTLSDVHITAKRGIKGNEHLAEIEGYTINATKKNELIVLSNINANMAMNNSRQIFSKTPGISIWENDGSGVQLGVASRGLSPNRSWEFNNRMNGYDITPDPMGYPEAYYTPPMEVVDRIEIVRGASSLQYGSQFGGLMNFVLRKPDISTKFTVESQNTVGSNGLFSTFNYVGGTVGRLSYTSYYQKRLGNGWRDNSSFDTDHSHLELSYAVSNKFKIGAEATYMMTQVQQAAGLTDVQFAENPKQSMRSRNWFSTPWFIPSLHAEYIFTPKTKISLKVFSTIAERNSVGNVKTITEVDVPNSARQVDRDYYTTLGTELRLLKDYTLFKKNHTMAAGVRYFNGHIDRKQLGKGSINNDMDFSTTDGSFSRDLDFNNINHAAFMEHIFRLSKRFLITAGARLENISSNIQGQLNVSNGTPQILSSTDRSRTFMIFGAGTEIHVSPQSEIYSNISQAYRPVLISDLTPPATTDVIDPNLQDADGYNFDLGYRGKLSNFLNFDVDYFQVNYNNRIGTITQTNELGKNYQFRTNLGQTISRGAEVYVEFDPISAFFKKSKLGYLSIFASLAYIDAKYTDFKTATLVDGVIKEGNLKGKRVENAPKNINRLGATYSKKGFSITWQLSDIGKAYSDANNMEKANAAATTGLIPSYTVQDLSASFRFLKHYNLKSGINNLTDERYFTRRAGGYPGPGLMPADGRTVYVSAGIKF
ncbi:MAG: TonB-dependent receptor domain-containing protein [Leadbetterella sp.]